jgi:hypothetical protein
MVTIPTMIAGCLVFWAVLIAKLLGAAFSWWLIGAPVLFVLALCVVSGIYLYFTGERYAARRVVG